MPTLVWDEVGSRYYEGGVDRGVLYLPSGLGVPWNGLVSVNENAVGRAVQPFYYDGKKYADLLAPGDFSATLKAYTYPEEFLQFEGVFDVGNGLFVGNQDAGRFGLSYRTKISNDTGEEGYKIHILYNLTATPSAKTYETIAAQGKAMPFEWTVTAVPEDVPGYRATAHLILDTRFMNQFLIEDIEDSLYGDGVTPPSIPALSSLVAFVDNWVIVRITDNFDGTWTAEGPDEYIQMLDATTFQLNQANAIYLDANTYMVSSVTH